MNVRQIRKHSDARRCASIGDRWDRGALTSHRSSVLSVLFVGERGESRFTSDRLMRTISLKFAAFRPTPPRDLPFCTAFRFGSFYVFLSLFVELLSR